MSATFESWWQAEVPQEQAAALLVTALWWACSCTDEGPYAVSIGAFPTGPDGGLPLPELRRLPLAA